MDYPSRWELPTFCAYCWTVHEFCGLSLETPYALVGERVLTREAYRDIGARLAEAAAEQLTDKGV